MEFQEVVRQLRSVYLHGPVIKQTIPRLLIKNLLEPYTRDSIPELNQKAEAFFGLSMQAGTAESALTPVLSQCADTQRHSAWGS